MSWVNRTVIERRSNLKLPFYKNKNLQYKEWESLNLIRGSLNWYGTFVFTTQKWLFEHGQINSIEQSDGIQFASRTEKGLVFWRLPRGHFKGRHVLVWVCRSCIDGLVQDCSISIAISCTKTSVYIFQCQWWYMHFSSGPSGKTLSYLYNAGLNWYRLLSSGVCNIENFLFRRNSYDFIGATSWWWCSESCCLRHMATAQWAWCST